MGGTRPKGVSGIVSGGGQYEDDSMMDDVRARGPALTCSAIQRQSP